ncbi:MAG TPA: hypothetical protein VF791_19895 [Pyrinomonadaceae bacterium]
MSLGLNGSNEDKTDAAYRALRIIWLAMLSSVVTIFVITRLVEPTPNEGLKVLFWLLLVMGLISLAASFVLKQKMLSQAVSGQSPELARGAYILGFALSEAPALFGLVAYFVTGIEYYYFFFVLSGFGIILHKPQRNDLLAASGMGKF